MLELVKCFKFVFFSSFFSFFLSSVFALTQCILTMCLFVLYKLAGVWKAWRQVLFDFVSSDANVWRRCLCLLLLWIQLFGNKGSGWNVRAHWIGCPNGNPTERWLHFPSSWCRQIAQPMVSAKCEQRWRWTVQIGQTRIRSKEYICCRQSTARSKQFAHARPQSTIKIVKSIRFSLV